MSTHHELLLQQRNAELEQRLAEKTTELREKSRELEIEAALERVRARTMAMYKSEELAETAQVLFYQLQELGGIPDRIAIGVADEAAGIVNFWSTDQSGSHIDRSFKARLNEPKVMAKTYQAWKEQKKSLVVDLHGDDVREWVKFAREEMGVIVKDEFIKDRRVHSFAFFSHGWILVTTHELQAPETIRILERFASVFSLTYRRFLDLENAESQAREAQIEAALERVRSKTMAMHSSDDVGETVAAMFAEFVHLGIHTNRCGILIFNDQQVAEVWTARATPEGDTKLIVGKLDLDAHKMLRSVYNAWNAKETSYQYDLLNDDLLRYYTAINNSKYYPTQFDLNALPSKEFHSDFFFTDGAVFSFTKEPVAEEHSKIIKRFAGVFGQTYRRFLDLQKAEAQAREAKVEISLEKVRTVALSLKKSDEMLDIAQALYEQLLELGFVNIRNAIIDLHNNKNETFLDYDYSHEMGRSVTLMSYYDHPIIEQQVRQIESSNDAFFEIILEGQGLQDLIEMRLKNGEMEDPRLREIDQLVYSLYSFGNGAIGISNFGLLSDDQKIVLKRFRNVFTFAYKRYTDLSHAEAQAREAQIEAGLERVRAKTMAMRTSDDVSAATATMFTELEKLGIENFRGGITNMHSNRTQHVWSVNNLAEGKVVKAVGAFNMDDHPFWQQMYKEWQEKNDFIHYFLAGEEKEAYVKILNSTQGYLTQAIENFPDVHFQVYFFNEGGVWTNSLQAHSGEERQIMKRFTSVFSLTFRRYKDLRKAEAQAREATIEAALEKVRGKAMAMQSSDDVSTATTVMFNELYKLGIKTIRCGILIINELQMMEVWSSASTKNGQVIRIVDKLDMTIHPLLQGVYKFWKNREKSFAYDLNGRDKVDYYRFLANYPGYMAIAKDQNLPDHFCSVFFFEEGGLYTFSLELHSEEHKAVLEKFTTVFSLTFRRYQDLKKSEANTREAIKQAALDRIRADIASMRTIEDLDRITPLIWNELTILGIPFIRCGVFIMDDVQELIHTFLSTPDGKAIAAFHLPYDTPGNFALMVNHWELKKMYVSRWTEDDFVGIAETLLKQGEITTKDQYLSSLPKGGFYLHFLPFLQGMLYVGNTEKLTEEQIELIQHVADAFSTAYARYEDFNRLEAAKQQVEKTLLEMNQEEKVGRTRWQHYIPLHYWMLGEKNIILRYKTGKRSAQKH